MIPEPKFNSDPYNLKKEMSETLEHLDILQMQSLNLFNKPEVHRRAQDLIDVLDDKAKKLAHLLSDPSPDEEQHLQNLIFNITRLNETIQDLKLWPLDLSYQQKFMHAKDQVRSGLDHLFH